MTILPPPPGTNSLSVAAQWTADILTGPVATSLAVISIAAIGYLMLNGRLDVRRGLRIVLGCFILFGAPAVAVGLRNATQHLEGERATPPMANPTNLTSPLLTAKSSADPYAGAAVRR